MLELKQSTAITLKIGPFVDEDDGKTAETALTISQADVRLSKNGGNMASKSQTSACTHDEIGVYNCSVNTTDTNALGRLQLFVHESGALPVWHEFMVLPANVYDSKYSTDYLQVDVVQVEGSDATDQIRDSVVDDATRIDASDLNTIMDDLKNAGRLDLLIDAIKAKTDNLPASPAAVGSEMTIEDNAITAAKLAANAITDSEISTAAGNKIADHILRRSWQSACDSANGDTKAFRSLLGSVAKLVNKVAVSGGTLTVYEDDDTTSLGTQSVTTDSGADPITALDTT